MALQCEETLFWPLRGAHFMISWLLAVRCTQITHAAAVAYVSLCDFTFLAAFVCKYMPAAAAVYVANTHRRLRRETLRLIKSSSLTIGTL